MENSKSKFYRKENPPGKKKKWYLLKHMMLTLLLCSLSYATVYASRDFHCDGDFTVTYDKSIGAYKIRMLLHDSETWAANKNFAILKNTTIQAQKNNEGWHNIIKLNGAGYFNVNFQYDHIYSSLTGWDGALWVENQQGSYQSVSINNKINVQYDYREDSFIFKTIIWYPPAHLTGSNLSFRLKEGMWDRRNNTNDTYFNGSCLKSNIRMEDPTSDINLTSNTIDFNGDNIIKYTIPNYNTTKDFEKGIIELQYSDNSGGNWNTIATKTSIDSNAGEFKGKYMNSSKNAFINGRMFRVVKKVTPASDRYNKPVYIKYSGTSTTEKYSVLTSFTVSQSDRTIKFNWAREGYYSNENGFYEILSKKDGQWVALSGLDQIALSRTSAEYTLSDSELRRGTVSYEFMIKRSNFNRDVYADFFQKTTSLSIETNYKPIENLRNTANGRDIILNWELGSGIWSNEDLQYTVLLNNVAQDPRPAISSSSYTLKNLETCKVYQIDLLLSTVNGGFEISKKTLLNISVPDDTPSKIKSLTTSKGYYSDKVLIRWEIPRDSNNFNYFILTRKELNSNLDAVLLEQITYNGNNIINYQDNNIDPGTYYQYNVEGFSECNQKFTSVAKESSIGFTQPYGSISGQIVYEGKQGVENVDVLVVGDEKNSSMKNRALEFSSTRDGNPLVNVPIKNKEVENFTFQAWIQIIDNNTDNKKTIIDIPDVLSLDYENGALKINDQIVSGDSIIRSLVYNHISLVYNKNNSNASLYLNGNPVGETTLISSADKNNFEVYIGGRNTSPIIKEELFNGYADEIRIWNRCLGNNEIKSNYDRFITGKEDGLVCYLRCDEIDEVKGVLFDLSALKSNFNGNDAVLGSSVLRVDTKDKVPTPEQLSTKATTDKYGNFLVNTVGYSNDGDVYNIIPMRGNHAFLPETRPVFVSSSSRVHNQIDFTDISSFTVEGKIVYTGTDYPVDGVEFLIDGTTLCTKDGEISRSLSDGSFNISVPIGEHFIKLRKNGHEFSNNGRYPADPNDAGTKIVFNAPVSGLTFTDNTLVTIAGRVAGGIPEKDKPIGFGESNANIGQATIELKLKSGDYRLNTGEQVRNLESSNQYINSTANIETGNGSNKITIKTDPETGEFMVKIPPVPLTVTSIKTKSTTIDTEQLSPLPDYINPLVTITDSTFTEDNKKLTFDYHQALNINYRGQSNFRIADMGTKNNAFGEKEIELSENETITLYNIDADDKVEYKFGYPIFKQLAKYKFEFSAFEEYINEDGEEPVITEIPLEGCVANVINEFGKQPVYVEGTDDGKIVESNMIENEVTLDSIGKGVYEFIAGYPNIHANHTLGLNISYIYNGETKNWKWDENPEGFRAIVLGDLTTGNDFVTDGPDLVSLILRDPPGSNSYAYYEKSTSSGKTTNWSKFFTQEGEETNVIHAGLTAQTITGTPGFGVITESAARADITLGLDWEVEDGDSRETSTITTLTQKINTSDSPDYVGADGDIFIGTSSNYVFGLTRNVGIYPDGNNGYRIDMKEVMAAGMKIGETAFKYTQSHIENNLIPNFYRLRNSLLKTVPPAEFNDNYINTTEDVIYITALTPDDERFGSLNNDESVWGSEAIKIDSLAYSGPSYKMILPQNATKVYRDDITHYTQQASAWEKQLEINEKAKVESINNGKKLINHSFDAGATVESSSTTCKNITTNHFHNYQVRNVTGVASGYTWSKIGFTSALELRTGGKEEEGSGSVTDTCTTTGYVLKDENPTDYFTIDIYEDVTNSGSVIFSTRGGRSSCPYEGEVKPKYYQSNTVLSAATMRVEVPEISAPEYVATNVPSGKEATFTLQLYNSSEVNADIIYDLWVREESNPDGAKLSIDGTPLTSRRPIFVKAGDEPVIKTLKLSQTSVDVLDYENIEIVLSSQCQDDIKDSILISAHFVPSCSDIAITINNRILNIETSDTLSVEVKDYRKDFKNFKGIRLQYKAVTDLSWTTFKEYEVADLPEAKFTYRYPMDKLSDGTYDIRAITICEYGTEDVYNESPEIRIVKDMHEPKSLGNPNPANGILTPESEISIIFNEEIQTGQINSNNIVVEGVLNGYTIQNNVGLNLDGTGNAYTELKIVNNESFSIEGWFRREPGKAGTLFTYGTNESYISAGFTTDNKLIIDNGEIQMPSNVIIDDTDWQYLSMVYDREYNDITVFLNSNKHGNISLLDNNSKLSKETPQEGRLYVGSKVDGTDKFSGQVRQVHLWNKKRALTDLTDTNKGKSGNERGLSGYWSLEEGRGTVATDKSHGRNMIVSTDWFIHPMGRSIAFDGVSDSLAIASYYYPFTEENDFTLEFWFKAGEQSNATLLSAGDGVNDKHIEGKMSLYLNPEGQLLLRNNGKETTVVPRKLTDDKWHHFAMSVNRQGNANFYIDNQQTYQTSSDNIGNYANAQTHLGVSKYEIRREPLEDTVIYNNWYKGHIDELRIWNVALTNENLKLDTYNRLTGKELGLVAYYPFDVYTKDEFGQYVISDTLADRSYNSAGELSKLQATGKIEFSEITPTLKEIRPKEPVKFSYVASDNKVVIDITEDLSRIENCILEFTVDRIMDMNGNRMSPKKWTAYIDLNRLKWAEERIELEKAINEPLTFKTSIMNNSGVNETFEIKDVPSWLECNVTSGVLKPQQQQELIFTVNENTMIGTYEAVVLMTGNNNVPEPFMVSMKVRGEKPNWTVDPSKYESSMNILGQIKVEGIYQEDTDDIIAAFIGNECRGVASPQYVQSHNSYYVFMDIYGNTDLDNNDSGKTVKFQLWDASTGFTYSAVNTSSEVTYKPLSTIGTINNPLIFDAMNIVEQQIPLRKGWNWISVNVVNDNPSLFDMFKNNIGDAGEIIKSASSYAQAPSWTGNGTFSIDNENMYRLQTNKELNLIFNGKLVDVTSTPVPISKGWNWIGYLPSFPLSLKEALAGINAKEGDMIKGQNNYATYVENVGWIGSLKQMNPGSGYMYHSQDEANKDLTYPSKASILKMAQAQDEIPAKWTVDHRNFQTNMTITGTVTINEEKVEDTGYEIGVFVEGECRGSAFLIYEDEFDSYLVYLMVYGDSGENMELKMYNHDSNQTFDSNDKLAFESDRVMGRPDNPYILNFEYDPVSITDNSLNGINIHPNPAKDYAYLTCPANLVDKIEVTDLSGQKLISMENISNKAIYVGDLAPGVYIVNIYSGGRLIPIKLMKE